MATLKLIRTDDVLSINDGEIILAVWIIDSHHESVIIRDAYGGLIVKQKISADNPIETDQGDRDNAADVIGDIGSNWRTRGFGNYYQWVFLGKASEIITKDDLWYYTNYGTGGSDVDVQIKDTQVLTLDGASCVDTGLDLVSLNKLTIHFVGQRNLGDLLVIAKYIDTNNRIELLYNTDNKIYLVIDNSFVNTDILSITSFSSGTMVFDGTKTGNTNRLKLYIDGVQISTPNSSGVIPNVTSSSSKNLDIGKRSIASYSTGILSNVVIWDDALSIEQINDISNSIELSSCKLNYNFQRGGGVVIDDLLGNGNHGTLIGATLTVAWGTRSSYAKPVLPIYGYERYESDTTPGEYQYVIFANGVAQSPTIPGFSYKNTVQPNAGFSNAGNTLDWVQGDAGLQALADKYNIANPITWDELIALDLSAIPDEDFNYTLNEDENVITDMVSEPYETVTYLGEIVRYLGEKLTSIKTHLIP